MEPQTARNDTPPLASATVVLVRDGAAGLEIFLVRRHGDSAVLGGAHVFPGGKVDREDAQFAARLDRPLDELQAALGESDLDPASAGALYVAAIRELFEETGVLCAPVPADQVQAAWSELRAGRRFASLLQDTTWPLQASRLAPWSRWITPVVGGLQRTRFDARFFLALVPPGQEASHDTHEATESVWLAPRAALLRYWEGDIVLAPPQIMTLHHLARCRDVAQAFAQAASRPPPCIRPQPLAGAEGRMLCYPGDPEHPEPQRVMPGPLRLAWRSGRFEPVGGLAALLPD